MLCKFTVQGTYNRMHVIKGHDKSDGAHTTAESGNTQVIAPCNIDCLRPAQHLGQPPPVPHLDIKDADLAVNISLIGLTSGLFSKLFNCFDSNTCLLPISLTVSNALQVVQDKNPHHLLALV
ncbi:hypothetical protein ABBQ38_000931 [Trebouxia sp. C0009 RCD-2024]